MEFAPLLAAVALIWKIVDVVQYLRAGNRDNALTQVGVWLAGIIVIVLLSASDFANGIDVAGFTLGNLNVASLILLGMSMGSTASIGVDIKKAIDNTDSAAIPAAQPDIAVLAANEGVAL